MIVTGSVTIAAEDYEKRGESSGLKDDRFDHVEVWYRFETVLIESRDKMEIGGIPHIKYKNLEAIRYAKKYCSQKKNSCGVYFQGVNRSDCAHFLSHCLHKGGITIQRESGPDECKDKLSVRVTEIVKVLSELSDKYKNVYPITYDEAIYGDPAYLETFRIRPSHAMLVHETRPVAGDPDKRETLYYAHSRERCGKEVGDLAWYQNFGGAFRIYDSN